MPDLISIIVPTLNAEEHIQTCIESLLALEYPEECLEITVIDNGSSDATLRIVEAYPVTLLFEPQRGAAAARNRGIQGTRGKIVAFADADCVVDPGWARAIDAAFGDPGIAALMGITEGIDRNYWAALEQRNWIDFWFHSTADGYELRRYGLDTRNAAVRRSVLETCGLLDDELDYCEDLELSIRLQQGRHCIELCPGMRARHRNRTDLEQILRVKELHGRAYYKVVSRLPAQFDSPHLPVNVRNILGIDNKKITGWKLGIALHTMAAVRAVVVSSLRGLSRFESTPGTLALKLYKTASTACWEIAILREKQAELE